MNIAGDEPDFIVALRLKSMAMELFSTEEWRQLVGLDPDIHELIQLMHDVSLIDMSLELVDGMQIAMWRLRS